MLTPKVRDSGIDFDDEELGFVEEHKSEVKVRRLLELSPCSPALTRPTWSKRENEAQFRDLVDMLDQPSLVANARQALAAIATPQVKAVNSRADRMTLSLGNPTTHPDSSLVMHVDVKKAVVPAGAPTMKQMSLRGFERVRTTQRAQQSQSQSQAFSQQLFGNGSSQVEPRGTKRAAETVDDPEDEEDEDAKAEIKRNARFAEQQNREHQAQMAAGQGVDLGKIGITLDRQLQNEGLAVGDAEDADLAGHGVTKERLFFYRPPPKPVGAVDAKDAKAKSGTAKVNVSRRVRDGGTVEQDALDDDEDDDEHLVQINQDETELTDAYHYGGSLIPIGDLEEGAGTLGGLKTGMEILTFMKQSDVRTIPPPLSLSLFRLSEDERPDVLAPRCT